MRTTSKSLLAQDRKATHTGRTGGETVTKVKGCSLNYRNSESLNFDTMKRIILDDPEALRTIGAVVQGGSTIFCAGSQMGCMKTSRLVIQKLDVKSDNFT